MNVTDGMSTAIQDGRTYFLQIYPRLSVKTAPCCTLKVAKDATAASVVKDAAATLGLDSSHSYVLAEVKECGGEEWILEPSDHPAQRVLLWPRRAQERHPPAKGFYFLLQERNVDGSIRYLHLPSLSREKEAQRLAARGFLPPQHKDFDDLCNLPILNEASILDNLQHRFHKDKIYTYAGSILIAINPFKFLPIYNPKYVKMYENHQLGKLEPHIFAIADVAYYAMLRKGINQCIVISGESGSGKTQSTNFLIHCLTALSQKGYASGVERTILGAGPVLEAFGNAKTAYNNNSSRFGKFIQVNYLESGIVRGAVVEKYLLEKSRLVSREKNERNYHVFYYLLMGASAEERKEFKLLQPEDYFYLKQHNFKVEDEEDLRHEFERLQQAMEMVGFLPATKKQIFSVLSAILYLGNVTYSRKSNGRDEGLEVGPPEVLSTLSDLLKVKVEGLVESLTKRTTVTVNDKLILPYSHSEAITARDSMAKSLYSALFDWIVLRINHALLNKKDMEESVKCLSIGVLDIFGFEDFVTNSFEQFCINYANEQLQYYFNQHIFKLEQEEYQSEGIMWHNIDYTDNVGCIHLISKKPTGLFYLLDEESNFPHATDKTLLAKFKQQHQNNKYFVPTPVMEPAFVIQHFAGNVKYQVTDFREKNTDHMRPDIVALLRSSECAYVRQLIGMDPVAMFRWAILRATVRSIACFNEAGRGWAARTAGLVRNKCRSPLAELQRTNMPVEKVYRCSLLEFSFDHSEEHPLEAFDDIFASYESKKKTKNPRQKQLIPKNLIDSQSLKFIVGLTLHDRTTKSLLHLHKKKKPPSISAQFQASLSKLLETLGRAEPFFIRCIRSNADKMEMFFDEALVLQQLRYTGMLETVCIRRSGYGAKYTFQEFVEQFRVLLPKKVRACHEDVYTLLQKMELDNTTYQIGKTKVFLKEPVRQHLQDTLHKDVMQKIIYLQRWFRAQLERKHYLTMRHSASILQRVWRHYCEQNRCRAAVVLQAAWRCSRQRALYLQQRTGIIKIQALARGCFARQRFHSLWEEKAKRRAEEEASWQTEQEAIERKAKEEAEQQAELEAKQVAEQQAELEAKQVAEQQAELEAKQVEEQQAELEAKQVAEQQAELEAKQEAERQAELEAKQEAERQAELKVKEEAERQAELKVKEEAERQAELKVKEEAERQAELKVKEEAERQAELKVKEEAERPAELKVKEETERPAELKVKEETERPAELKVKEETERQAGAEAEAELKAESKVAVQAELESLRKTDMEEIARQTEQEKQESKVKEREPEMPLQKEAEATSSHPNGVNLKSKSAENYESTPVLSLLERAKIVKSKEHFRASGEEPRVGNTISTTQPTEKSMAHAEELRSHPPKLHKTGGSKSQEKRELRRQRGLEHSHRECQRAASLSKDEPPHKTKAPESAVLKGKSPQRMDMKELEQYTMMAWAMKDEKGKRETKCPSQAPSRPSTLLLDTPTPQPSKNGYGQPPSPTGSGPLQRYSKQSTMREKAEKWRERRVEGGPESNTLENKAKTLPNHGISVSADNLYKLNSYGCDFPSGAPAHREIASVTDVFPDGSKVSTVKKKPSDTTAQPISSPPSTPERAGFLKKILKKRPHKEAQTPDDGEQTGFHTLNERSEETTSSQTGRSPSIKISRGTRVSEPWNSSLDREITNINELLSLDEFLRNQVNDLHSTGKNLSGTERLFILATEQFRHKIKDMCSTQNYHIDYKMLMSSYQSLVHTFAAETQKSEIQFVVNLFQSVLDIFIRGEIRKVEAEPFKPSKARKKRRKKDKSMESPLDHMFNTYQVNIKQSCDHCSSHIRVMEKACMCSSCRMVCHKKCLSKISTACSPYCTKKSEGESNSNHFGVHLCLLTNEENLYVPVVLEMMLAHIELNGLYTEGIYRKSGSANRMKELHRHLEIGPTAVCLQSYPIHTIAGLVKQWLRELPDPLMTFTHYNDFLHAVELPEKQEQLHAVYKILDQLPTSNFSTLERLIFHLVRVAKEEAHNRMSANALAIVFAPCILRCPDSADPFMSMKDVAKTTICVEMIINEQTRLYNERMDAIDQLEYAEAVAVSQLHLRRRNTHYHLPLRFSSPLKGVVMRDKGTSDLKVAPESDAMDSDTEAEKSLMDRIQSIKQEKADLACRLPDLEQPGSDQENLDSEASVSSESLLDGRGGNSDMEGGRVKSQHKGADVAQQHAPQPPLHRPPIVPNMAQLLCSTRHAHRGPAEAAPGAPTPPAQ